MVTTAIAKRAVKRDPTAPVGQRATLYWVDCGCGRCVPINSSNNPCACGVVYDDRGWVLAAVEVYRAAHREEES